MSNETSTPSVPKSLAELYGTGTGNESLDPRDEQFMPLMMAIEEPFALAYRRDKSLTDGSVIAALDKLCLNPEADYPHEPLAGKVQTMLKAVLSLNNYSRQDVRLALRKVKQSVNRHNKLGGTRGYLTFINDFIPGR
jgi:hypothetical protein